MNIKDKIILKQDEYIRYLKRAIHSESIIDNITAGARDIYDFKLIELKSQDKEVTDEDIEKAAEDHAFFIGVSGPNINIAKQVSFIQGAKSMRDGEIKHNK
jgi:hypothetical protein